MGTRRAKFSEFTPMGFKCGISSARRCRGITPVARHGTCSFTSVCHFCELLGQIEVIDKHTLFEEGGLDPTDQILDRTLLLRLIGPAQFGDKADFEGGLSKGVVPAGDGAVFAPRGGHGFGSVEDASKGNAPKPFTVFANSADKGFCYLIEDNGNSHKPRVLETRRKKENFLFLAIGELHPDLAEIVLRKFSGQAPMPVT